MIRGTNMDITLVEVSLLVWGKWSRMSACLEV